METIDSSIKSVKCLAVIFRPKLTLAILNEYPPETLVFNGISYKEMGFDDWTGHYDWLRDANGVILGVRYIPFEEKVFFLIEHVKQFQYVNAEEGYFEIYFSSNRDIDGIISSDQAFGDNFIYSSEQQEHVITFGTTWLQNHEFEMILAVQADWVIPEPTT